MGEEEEEEEEEEQYCPLWKITVDMASPQRAQGARPALAFVE